MLYDKIKFLCDEKGISIRQLEIQAGIANGVVRCWGDESKPKAYTLNRVAKVLGTTVDELLREENERDKDSICN